MATTDKPRVITSFEKVSDEIQEQIKLEYPEGFSQHLIKFPLSGEMVSALRFETEEKIYLLKMTKSVAQQIIEDDDDYGDDGVLKEDAREDYEEKHGDGDFDDDDSFADDDDSSGSDDSDDKDD